MLNLSKNTIIVFTVTLLFFAFIWSRVLADCSFFTDSEKAPQTDFQSAILDFSLSADNDFSPYVSPGVLAAKDIKITNNGSLPFVYDVSLLNATGTLCADLSLAASLDGVEVYNGDLLDFNLHNASLAVAAASVLSLRAGLTDLNAQTSSSSCLFDLNFFGNQVNNDTGFSDFEMMSNIIAGNFQPMPGDHLLITKVYYHAAGGHGQNSYNEWLEIYNPTSKAVDLHNYQLCNKEKCVVIDKEAILNPAQFAIITRHPSTWRYWTVPDGALKIDFLGEEGIFWSNNADLVILRDRKGEILDQMNYGMPQENWLNYNEQVWQPGVSPAPYGGLLLRYPYYLDTDASSDWRVYTPPTVRVINPNGGEVWWVGHLEKVEWQATNNNGDDSELRINIYYSADSGETWALLVGNTENDGEEEFRLPLFLAGGAYWVPSGTARVKVVAIGPENIMAQNYDISDNDFCPPIDYNLITPEERQALIDMGYLVPDILPEPTDDELRDLSIDLSQKKATTSDSETKMPAATSTLPTSSILDNSDNNTATNTIETVFLAVTGNDDFIVTATTSQIFTTTTTEFIQNKTNTSERS